MQNIKLYLKLGNGGEGGWQHQLGGWQYRLGNQLFGDFRFAVGKLL